MTYDEWMEAVDEAVVEASGVSVHDLPDQPFRDWYQDDMDPKDAAEMALEEAGFDG